MRLLAGDIGGTNARLVLYECSSSSLSDLSTHRLVSQVNYKNDNFESFSDVLGSFLSTCEGSDKIESCCLAVAGPVSNNRIEFTNRAWTIDGGVLQKEFEIDRVELVNDFAANGYGLLTLPGEEIVTIQEGRCSNKDAKLPIALVGAGTGLGECYMTASGCGEYCAYATEGGHVEFAPRSMLERELLAFLQRRMCKERGIVCGECDVLPQVSVERFVSGKGLEVIYEFLREKYADKVQEGFDNMYNTSSERGGLIGMEKDNYELFRESLALMFGAFGGEVGNVALKYLPFGGVYIAGGITVKNMEFVRGDESVFMKRLRNKGRLSEMMQQFPVHVVLAEDIGMRGAHSLAARNAAKLGVGSANGH